MKFKSLVTATALACLAGSALAGDQSVAFSGTVASFDSTAPVLAGGDDVISFTGLAAGLYDFTLTMSGQWLTLSSATLNGTSGTLLDTGKWTFLGIDGTSNSPLALTLVGTADKATALYSGELSVTAVPEPESYALLLAGLGAVGFMVRRRRPRD